MLKELLQAVETCLAE